MDGVILRGGGGVLSCVAPSVFVEDDESFGFYSLILMTFCNLGTFLLLLLFFFFSFVVIVIQHLAFYH